MNITVYRQNVHEKNGVVVYKGEDARPYADERLLMVADGLGGSGAIRHTKLKRELFNNESLMDVLFKDVFDDYGDEEFVRYVQESFYELFAVKDHYDEIRNVKKSGYFGSRITAAILLHEVLYNKEYYDETIFNDYSHAEENGAAQAFLNNFGEKVKNKIQIKLKEIARNANLFNETIFDTMTLLGTTLCATIYKERDKYVEALYLTAGDSRPYVWTLENGLCQLLEDEEGPDGGMTNCISANENSKFHIRCNYFKINKPCVLFNTSDGCFECFGLSQLQFEKLLLEYSKESSSIEVLSEKLKGYFEERAVSVDDSSTIAMKIFGYDSYDQFKNAVSQRWNKIEQEYISVMPDLLEDDYVAQYERFLKSFPIKLATLKEKFEAEAVTKKMCREYIVNGKYPDYNEKLQAVQAKIDVEKQKISRSRENIKRIIDQNYVKFLPYLHKESERCERRKEDRIHNTEKKYINATENYVSALEKYRGEFEESVQKIRDILEKIDAIGIPENFEDYDDVGLQVVRKCEQSMDDLFTFFSKIRNHKQYIVARLTRKRRQYIDENRKLAADNSENVKKLVTMIVDGEISIENNMFKILQDDYEEMNSEIGKIRGYEAEIERMNAEDIENLIEKSMDDCWQKDHAKIIEELIKREDIDIGEELREEADAVINEYNEQMTDIRSKSEMQMKLLSKYDKGYEKYIGVSEG